jgi:20S proteasome alpha/beta subunit
MYNFNFCDRTGRCSVCGGTLNKYELKHQYLFHLDKDMCIEVLQNTITILSENDNHNFEILSYLVKDFTQEQIEELEKIVESKL